MDAEISQKTGKSPVFAIAAIVTCVLGLVASILAFGLPYWVYFDEMLSVVQSGTTYDVRLRYNYGFWSYCNHVTSDILHSNRCAAAQTSSDTERTTVCCLAVVVILTVSATVSLTLFVKCLRGEKFCLYMATVSLFLAGIIATTGVINFGLQDHSVTVSETITLQFTTSNLHAAFWLAAIACLFIVTSAALAVAAIIHARNNAATDVIGIPASSQPIGSHVSLPTVAKEVRHSDDDAASTTSSQQYPFLSSGASKKPFFVDNGVGKKPFYAETSSDENSEDELVFSKAPLATALTYSGPFGPPTVQYDTKDMLKWKTGPHSIANQSTTTPNTDVQSTTRPRTDGQSTAESKKARPNILDNIPEQDQENDDSDYDCVPSVSVTSNHDTNDTDIANDDNVIIEADEGKELNFNENSTEGETTQANGSVTMETRTTGNGERRKQDRANGRNTDVIVTGDNGTPEMADWEECADSGVGLVPGSESGFNSGGSIHSANSANTTIYDKERSPTPSGSEMFVHLTAPQSTSLPSNVHRTDARTGEFEHDAIARVLTPETTTNASPDTDNDTNVVAKVTEDQIKLYSEQEFVDSFSLTRAKTEMPFMKISQDIASENKIRAVGHMDTYNLGGFTREGKVTAAGHKDTSTHGGMTREGKVTATGHEDHSCTEDLMGTIDHTHTVGGDTGTASGGVVVDYKETGEAYVAEGFKTGKADDNSKDTVKSTAKSKTQDMVTNEEAAGGSTVNTRAVEDSEQAVRPKSSLKRKKHKTKGQKQLEVVRIQRSKTLANIYGGSNMRVGGLGSTGPIPAPNPILGSKKAPKQPSAEVVTSGKKLMTSLMAFKKMRQGVGERNTHPGHEIHPY